MAEVQDQDQPCDSSCGLAASRRRRKRLCLRTTPVLLLILLSISLANAFNSFTCLDNHKLQAHLGKCGRHNPWQAVWKQRWRHRQHMLSKVLNLAWIHIAKRLKECSIDGNTISEVEIVWHCYIRYSQESIQKSVRSLALVLLLSRFRLKFDVTAKVSCVWGMRANVAKQAQCCKMIKMLSPVPRSWRAEVETW